MTDSTDEPTPAERKFEALMSAIRRQTAEIDPDIQRKSPDPDPGGAARQISDLETLQRQYRRIQESLDVHLKALEAAFKDQQAQIKDEVGASSAARAQLGERAAQVERALLERLAELERKLKEAEKLNAQNMARYAALQHELNSMHELREQVQELSDSFHRVSRTIENRQREAQQMSQEEDREIRRRIEDHEDRLASEKDSRAKLDEQLRQLRSEVAQWDGRIKDAEHAAMHIAARASAFEQDLRRLQESREHVREQIASLSKRLREQD
ncbi:MAG: hypothetical protein HY922_06975 [Elusimicrobia bacterium]|nr:hypothetical protein [Elusimicrobiota bacterium]